MTTLCAQGQDQRSAVLRCVKRVVLKVGSALIAPDGMHDPFMLNNLAGQVARLQQSGYEVIMVVSGAVAGGYRSLGKSAPPSVVVERQAAACIGQYRLMSAVERAFEPHGIQAAQLLMMEGDIENRRRFLSARHTLQLLIDRGIIPVINENDALSDDEEQVGDNDHLAAMVTNLVSAQLLIILSRVEGLYDSTGQVIDSVTVASDVHACIRDEMSATGVGGMAAKMTAARLAARYGVPTVIAGGQVPEVLSRLLDGEHTGTLVQPRASCLNARRRWVVFRNRSRGALRVDAGAKRAICDAGSNLLPAGVTHVVGAFDRGARVDIQDDSGQTFAVGLVSYSADEIRRMQGRSAADYVRVLGYEYVPEIIDSRDLALIGHS